MTGNLCRKVFNVEKPSHWAVPLSAPQKSESSGMNKHHKLESSSVTVDDRDFLSCVMPFTLHGALQNHLPSPLDPTVNHCAFSCDGHLLITGSNDCKICVWDTRSENCLVKAKGHEGPVRACAFSADSILFASGSADCMVRVWDTARGNCLHILKGHSKSVETVAFSNDSQVLASAGWDYTVILWEPKLGQPLKKLLGHHNVIKTCAGDYIFITGEITLLRRGRFPFLLLATGSWDFKVILWSLQSTCQVILHGHTGNISCVAFSNIGMLASGSWDKTVRVWDPRNGILIFLLENHSHHLLALSFSLDAILLMTAAEDGTVRVWDCEDGKCKRVLEVMHSCLCFGWITNRNNTGCLEYCTQYFAMLCTFVVTLLKELPFTSKEWNTRADLSRQLQFPMEITTSRCPYLVLWSMATKTVVLIELTMPWEHGRNRGSPQAEELKYSDLATECKEDHHQPRGGRTPGLYQYINNKVTSECASDWRGAQEGH
ncbi:uncharacterized protein [Mobula birostris]|uniref:uncharacterized protein n=1 Tax=Mobula birostris TaxID=1983395 RepID=UPI003B28512E